MVFHPAAWHMVLFDVVSFFFYMCTFDPDADNMLSSR